MRSTSALDLGFIARGEANVGWSSIRVHAAVVTGFAAGRYEGVATAIALSGTFGPAMSLVPALPSFLKRAPMPIPRQTAIDYEQMHLMLKTMTWWYCKQQPRTAFLDQN